MLPLMALPFYPLRSQDLPAPIMKIHHRACVIDTHTDTPMALTDGSFDPALRNTAPDYRVDFPRLREGEVDAVFFAIYTAQRERTPENYERAYALANRMLDSTWRVVQRNSNVVQMAASRKDIMRIAAMHKTAICLGMENGFPLGKDISRVKEFYDRGVRYITLCHSSNNDICDSSTDKKGAEHNGLSSFGRDVVTAMNQSGMMVDVSHISDKAFYDVLEVSKAPVIASHSSVRAICDHPRNMSDDMIRALAQNGGVIQICILGAYIEQEDTTSDNYVKLEALRVKHNDWNFKDEQERREAWRAYDSINTRFPPVLPAIARAVDHIDHVVRLAGIDHVGIGSDFDGGGGLADCTDVADFPKITAELVKRGYSRSDIAKIWGGNFLRVYKAVEKAALH
jgi:membrane dipeptidase